MTNLGIEELETETAAPPDHAKRAAALRRLTELVTAARMLRSVWVSLDDDAAVLDTGYPRGWPSFDELCEELDTWHAKVKAAV